MDIPVPSYASRSRSLNRVSSSPSLAYTCSTISASDANTTAFTDGSNNNNNSKRSMSISPPGRVVTPTYIPRDVDSDMDVDVVEPGEELLAPQRGRLGRLATRSVQSLGLRKESRGRSMTDAKPPLLPPATVSLPVPVPPTQKKGGFSGFIRRLTRKKPKASAPVASSSAPPLPPPPPPPPSIPLPPLPSYPTGSAPAFRRPPTMRQETAPAASPYRVSTLSPRSMVVRQSSTPQYSLSLRGHTEPLSYAPMLPPKDANYPSALAAVLGLAPSAPQEAAPVEPRVTDPRLIPLPPSPTLTPSSSHHDTLTDFGPPVPKAQDERDNETGEEEEEDILPPLRIQTARPASPASLATSTSMSASGSTSGVRSAISELVQTPTSINSTGFILFSPPSDDEDEPVRPATRYAGSSPPVKAPIGVGLQVERRKSRWRQSAMDLQGSLSGNAARKSSYIREPPTSHDACVATQRRLANSRLSCQPTLHSRASIAAELREIKGTEEARQAEVFFLH